MAASLHLLQRRHHTPQPLGLALQVVLMAPGVLSMQLLTDPHRGAAALGSPQCPKPGKGNPAQDGKALRQTVGEVICG